MAKVLYLNAIIVVRGQKTSVNSIDYLYYNI